MFHPTWRLSHLLITLCFLVLAVPAVSALPHRRNSRDVISGKWQLNTILSRNGRSELPGQLNGGAGLLPVSATESWTYAEADPRTTELIEATELLEIFSSGHELTMNATGGAEVVFTRTFYTDGRVLDGGDPARKTIRGQWDNGTLLVDSRWDETSVHETYRVVPDTDQLQVTIMLTKSTWKEPVQISRSYDRVGNVR